jgi:hypothetical protein
MIPPPPKTLRQGTAPPPPVAGTSPAKAQRASGGAPWRNVLRRCGWPTTVVTLDFECYFDREYTLSKLSTIEYVTDSRFEVIGLARQLWTPDSGRSPSSFWWGETARADLCWLQMQYGKHLEGCTCVFQNSRFDCSILAKHYGIFPRYTVDVKALSAHLDARAKHKLASLAEEHGLAPKGDTMQFLGLHLADMTPEQRTAMSTYANHDAELETELFTRLLPRLTWPEVELRLQHETLGMFTKARLGFDYAEARKIITEMQTVLAGKIAATGLDLKALRGDNSFVEALAGIGVECPMKYGAKKLIPALAKDDEGVKLLQKHADPRVRAMIAGRQASDSWPLHIGRVIRMATQAKANGDMLPNPLNYYGAHTGRWSGGERINTQNLSSRGEALTNRVRGVLVAPSGCSLVVADAAQIEARVLAWLAGQDDLVAAFERGEDVYSQFASTVFAAPVRKPTKDDSPEDTKTLTYRRACGKVGILGMGYGMGKVRALEYFAQYPDLEDKLESGEIDILFSDQMVKTYRATYPRIPQFWSDIEAAFKRTTKYGQAQELPHLKLWRDGTTTVIQLPSTRCLFFKHATSIMGERGRDELRWHYGKLWGGTIVENVVQATARDILALAWLECIDNGLPVGHHIHDELVGVVPTDEADAALKHMISYLSHRPDWAAGCPLAAEGKVCSKYGK